MNEFDSFDAIQQLNPVPADHSAGSHSVDQLARVDALFEEITSVDPPLSDRSMRKAASPRWWNGRRLVIGVAALAVFGLLAGVLLARDDSDAPGLIDTVDTSVVDATDFDTDESPTTIRPAAVGESARDPFVSSPGRVEVTTVVSSYEGPDTQLEGGLRFSSDGRFDGVNADVIQVFEAGGTARRVAVRAVDGTYYEQIGDTWVDEGSKRPWAGTELIVGSFGTADLGIPDTRFVNIVGSRPSFGSAETGDGRVTHSVDLTWGEVQNSAFIENWVSGLWADLQVPPWSERGLLLLDNVGEEPPQPVDDTPVVVELLVDGDIVVEFFMELSAVVNFTDGSEGFVDMSSTVTISELGEPQTMSSPPTAVPAAEFYGAYNQAFDDFLRIGTEVAERRPGLCEVAGTEADDGSSVDDTFAGQLACLTEAGEPEVEESFENLAQAGRNIFGDDWTP